MIRLGASNTECHEALVLRSSAWEGLYIYIYILCHEALVVGLCQHVKSKYTTSQRVLLLQASKKKKVAARQPRHEP
jgi:hypothetical protein